MSPVAAAALGPGVDKDVTIYIGGVHASDTPTLVKTLLGSCIAVCLWDPVTRVGGMNHFMLPHGGGSGFGEDATRFGVHAMDRLIGATMKSGGDRRRLVAKVFGGAHVLQIRESVDSVPQQNIQFIRSFLSAESLPVLGEDVGGHHPRHVHFHTGTGIARVKRVTSAGAQARLVERERVQERADESSRYGTVELFA